MKRATGLFTGAALVLSQMAMAQVTPATAAVPFASGKYAFFDVLNCEAQISVTKDAQGKVTGVTLTRSGAISAYVGYLTFTPSSPGATSGTATQTGTTRVGGGAVKIINGNSTPWTTSPHNLPAKAYSFTATTVTIGGQVFQITYGNLVGGVYKTFNFLARQTDTSPGNNPNVDCLNGGTLTKPP